MQKHFVRTIFLGLHPDSSFGNQTIMILIIFMEVQKKVDQDHSASSAQQCYHLLEDV